MYLTKIIYRDDCALETERDTANSIKRQYLPADQAHSHAIDNLLQMEIILSDFGRFELIVPCIRRNRLRHRSLGVMIIPPKTPRSNAVPSPDLSRFKV
jgi:hypothetical protein